MKAHTLPRTVFLTLLEDLVVRMSTGLLQAHFCRANVCVKWQWLSCGQGLLCAEKSG